jgi:hypothetical protein
MNGRLFEAFAGYFWQPEDFLEPTEDYLQPMEIGLKHLVDHLRQMPD